MGESRNQKSFWVTLPGLLTEIIALTAAIIGLIGGLAAAGLIGGGEQPDPTSALPTVTPASVPPNVTPNSTLVSDLNKRGATSYRQGQYDQALNYYQKALVIYREVEDRAGEGYALNSIGSVYGALGQYDQPWRTISRLWLSIGTWVTE
jgi:tetratricopeptide (TPR) repeat protein